MRIIPSALFDYSGTKSLFNVLGPPVAKSSHRGNQTPCCRPDVTTVISESMKRIGLVLAITLLVAGCTANAAGNRTDLDAFDESLAKFQKHLETCPYPGAHTMEFARSWNVPEFVIQAYVPKGVAFAKGKITD